MPILAIFENREPGLKNLYRNIVKIAKNDQKNEKNSNSHNFFHRPRIEKRRAFCFFPLTWTIFSSPQKNFLRKKNFEKFLSQKNFSKNFQKIFLTQKIFRKFFSHKKFWKFFRPKKIFFVNFFGSKKFFFPKTSKKKFWKKIFLKKNF